MKSISPTPWTFEYSPYRLQNGVELPAYEVLDANGEKIFDTNELTLTERQEDLRQRHRYSSLHSLNACGCWQILRTAKEKNRLRIMAG